VFRNFVTKGAAWAAVMALVSWSALWAGGLPKPASQNALANQLIDQAWQLDRSQSGAAIYQQCLDLLEQADKLDPNNPHLLTELSRLTWKYGAALPRNTDDQRDKIEEIYEQGMAHAERSLAIKETVGGHYWHAINHSATLEFCTIIGQAAAFPSIYGHYLYMDDHGPDYYYGAAARLWIDLLARMPKQVVESADWDLQEAMKDLDHAIAAEPRFLENYLTKARFHYYYHDDREGALKLIGQALRQDPQVFPEEAMNNKYTQQSARKLWKEITGQEYPRK
jgi:hypothetical protein